MAFLRYLDDAEQIQTKVLDAEQFVIGRAPTCQLTFESDMISREHVRIDLEPDGRYRIHDLGSRNKTYVNGELIRDTLLTSGAVIRAGDHVLEFLDDSACPEKIDLEFLTPDRQDPPDTDWIKPRAGLSLTTGQIEQLSQLLGEQPLTARAEDIADAVVGRIILDTQAERGFVGLRGESKTTLRPLAHRGLKRPTGSSLTPVSQTFVITPMLQRVAGRYPQTAGQIDSKLGFAAAAMITPMTFRGEVVGAIYVDRPHAKKPFNGAALQYFAAAGALVGALLGESQRRLTSFARREGATWMTAIRRIQSSLADPVTSSEAFDAASRLWPGRLRCGDFASVIHIDEQRCAAVVIDGGGHGITGVTQATGLRMAVESALAVSEDALTDPAVIFNVLNRQIAASRARQIIPFAFVGIDMSSGKLAYINAGGKPPLLMVAPGRLVTLDQVSLVVGVDVDYIFQTTRVDLPEAFRVVCCTDGLTEATSAAGEALGDQRLHETLLERDSFTSASDVIAAISSAWTAHMAAAQPEDDALALVVARG